MISTGPFRKAMRAIASKKGDFILFGLFKRANSVGNWDLVVAAPWLESDTLEVTRKLVRLLRASIGAKTLLQLSRVAIVGGDEPGVKFIVKNLAVDDGEIRVRNTELFGLEIEDALIFRAKASKAPARKGARGRQTTLRARQHA